MGNGKRPIPYGFEEDAMRPHKFLFAKYHCNQKQVSRWRTELGLPTTRAGHTVEQYTLDGEFVRSYPSMRFAVKCIGEKCSENISNCANGKHKTAYGFIWRFSNADGLHGTEQSV